MCDGRASLPASREAELGHGSAGASHPTASERQVNLQQLRVFFTFIFLFTASLPFAHAQSTSIEFRFNPKEHSELGTNVEVQAVHLAGSFNDWNRTAVPMTKQADGTYVARLTLDDGLYHYKFVVNRDIWFPDPHADPSLREDDGHEGYNSGVDVGPQGKEFGTSQPNNINLAAVHHDSRQIADFDVVSDDTVNVRLRTLQDDVQHVTLRCRDGHTRDIAMQRVDTSHGFDYWAASVPIDRASKSASYHFVLTSGSATINYGDGGSTGKNLRWFTADVTERFPTPDWARNVVWYQIFTDRFRNGTTENDPPHTLPWRWDWYKLEPWEHWRDGVPFSNDWYGRRFGGDFQGVMSELPYFRELGVTAIYFCPIFESGSNHG